MAYDCFAVCIPRGGQGNLSDCQDAGMRLIKKEERRKEQGMAVNNVNALSPFGTVQGSQASAKTEQVAQERFDKLMNKVSDQLTGLQKAQAGNADMYVSIHQNASHSAKAGICGKCAGNSAAEGCVRAGERRTEKA